MSGKVDVEELGRQVLGMANSLGRDESDAFVRCVLGGHRTLVQQFFDRVVLESIRQLSSSSSFDDRNRAAKEAADALMGVLKERGLDASHLPFI